MSDAYTRQAFHDALADTPTSADAHYVSLYARVPVYGGPEEGGWWGSDCELRSYYKFATLQQAEDAYERIFQLAETLSQQSKAEWAEHCARECEHAEARGMDPADLPETDGETSYFATVERVLNSHARTDDRQWS